MDHRIIWFNKNKHPRVRNLRAWVAIVLISSSPSFTYLDHCGEPYMLYDMLWIYFLLLLC
jgi:hypothetical protein